MLSDIIKKIETTSQLKQKLFEQVTSFFADLEKTCREVAIELQKKSANNAIAVKIEKINDYEFLFRVGRDVLVLFFKVTL